MSIAVTYPQVVIIANVPKIIAAFERMRLPSCAVDDTHVPMVCPSPMVHVNVNQKGYYSL